MSTDPSRGQGRRVALGLASLLLVACAPRDPAEPPGGPATQRASAEHPGPARAFFVSPAGSPFGDGSFSHPWDLATALDGPPAVTPGSTIWLRGGTYDDGPHFDHGYLSNLTGTPDAPIVVRQYPGERATITKFLFIRGGYTWYWGFEVVHPVPHVGNAFGIDTRAPGTKLINLVVHDASASGIFIGPEATNAEVYGSIFYNNGRTDNLDHGIYCQSQSSSLVKDNIIFDNWAFGIHCYSETGPYLQNIRLEGNAAFNNYVWGAPSGADVYIGGLFPASGVVVDQNYTYRTRFSNTKVADVGYFKAVNGDLVLTNNHFIGGWIRVGLWARATVTGNTLFNFTTGGMLYNIGSLSDHAWSGNSFVGDSTLKVWLYRPDGSDSTTKGNDTIPVNALTSFSGWRTLTGLANAGTYSGSVPTQNTVAVRPNQYQPGRANIIVYNWAQQSMVDVDLSGVLNPGDHYVVQNAQDLYGAPAASGIYTGGPIPLPMVGVTPPLPLGVDASEPAPVTGPTFNVFLLMRTKPTRGPGHCPPADRGRSAEAVDYLVAVGPVKSRPGAPQTACPPWEQWFGR